MILQREEALINTFVVARKRERYLGFLRSPRRRQDFLRTLYHFSDFDPACIVPLADGKDSADALVSELRRRGAAGECYVISADRDFDGLIGLLESVIVQVHAAIEGSIVCCLPRRLAYYEGESPRNRFILHRQVSRR